MTRLKKSTCTWRLEKHEFLDSDGVYDTECRETFQFFTGDAKDNSFKFCPYCGKYIHEEIIVHKEEDECEN